jgi:hypothetical protein
MEENAYEAKIMLSVARLLREMPEGYEAACFSEKAIQRKREISEPGDLMMLSLFHLLNGSSLEEVKIIAEMTKLGTLSDVALMKRFAGCNNWYLWIISNLVTNGAIPYTKPEWLEGYNVYGVDASDVKEKGRSGRIYRLHFALDLFNMKSEQYAITTNKVGEALRNFKIKQNDLVVGDRGYVSLNGVEHCIDNGGNCILRLRKNSFTLYGEAGNAISLIEHMRNLGDDDSLDLRVFAKGSKKGERIALRVCAKRKTPQAIAETKKKLKRTEYKQQSKISDGAKEFNEYIVLISNLPSTITSEQILDTYRLRWQVEIYFKRLKSILDFGQLPKRREDCVMAWLNGKLMIALLIEKIVGATLFSPVHE